MINRNIIHAVVIEWPDGGQQYNCFIKEDSALKEVSELKKILKNNPNKLKVFLSYLNYDYRKNLITDGDLVNEDSIKYV